MMDYQKNGLKINPVLIEKDRDQRELEWQAIDDIVNAAKTKFLNGDISLEDVMFETVEAIKGEREKRIEYLSVDPSEELIKEDLRLRREEELIKGERQN